MSNGTPYHLSGTPAGSACPSTHLLIYPWMRRAGETRFRFPGQVTRREIASAIEETPRALRRFDADAFRSRDVDCARIEQEKPEAER
jgi:hypothetical protein